MYDMDVHLPQQMENFLNAFAEGDAGGLQRIKKNIIDIVKNEKFEKDLDDYEMQRQKKYKEICNNSFKIVETAFKSENIGDLFGILNKLREQLETDIQVIEGEYWDNVKKYISGYIDKMDKK